jgi:hypothetical protein
MGHGAISETDLGNNTCPVSGCQLRKITGESGNWKISAHVSARWLTSSD